MNSQPPTHTCAYSYYVWQTILAFEKGLLEIVCFFVWQLDVAIDGADEVDTGLTLIKGGG